MEVSRIVFRKETKEAMEKKLTNRERGKLLYERLKECDANGKLNLASNRKEVVNLVGGTLPWVHGMINRRYLTETLQGFDNGKLFYEYHLTGKEPDYDYHNVGRRKAKKKVGQELRRWQDKVEAEQIPQAPVLDYDTTPQIIERARVSNPIKIEITRGDMTIKVEMDGYEQASKLITTMLKGE